MKKSLVFPSLASFSSWHLYVDINSKWHTAACISCFWSGSYTGIKEIPRNSLTKIKVSQRQPQEFIVNREEKEEEKEVMKEEKTGKVIAWLTTSLKLCRKQNEIENETTTWRHSQDCKWKTKTREILGINNTCTRRRRETPTQLFSSYCVDSKSD